MIKRTFEKNCYPFSVALWSKRFLTLAKNCTKGLSKPISTCSVIILKKQRFPKNLLRVWYILGPWEFFSDFWGKIFRKAVKTDSYTFRQTLWLKTNLLENFLHSFGLWLMHFFDWWQFYRCKSFKTAFYDFREHSDKKNFFEKHFLIFSGPWAIHFLTFGKNFTKRLSKLFCTCAENIFKMRIFSIVLFLAQIWFLSNFFLTCGTNFSVKLSKLLSPCLDEHFDGKHFFGKFFNLSLDFERNIFWTWVKITQKSSQKRILRVQKTFWWNWLFGELFDQYVY